MVLDSLTPTGLDPFFIIVAYAMALKEESDTAESAGSGKFSTSEFYKKEKEENDRKRPEAQKYVQDVETWLEDHGFSPVPVP